MNKKIVKLTYKRQRFLLSYICQLDKEVSATDVQKLIFLYSMREKSEYYEFVPYKFGPYSFQLAKDIDTLCQKEYLVKNNSKIKSNEDYYDGTLFPIAPERGKKLIKKAYREYPYYTINSEIIDQLFDNDEANYFKKIRQTYLKKEQILFTIGYEEKSVESFMNLLIQNDVRLLCDIRKNSISRKFGFSKRKLNHIANSIGIKYIHIPELGIESNKRSSLNSKNDYKSLFYNYEESLPKQKKHLEKIYSLLCDKNRIALMCYEKNPEMCHRKVVRDYIVKKYNKRSIDL